jgi:hypothetical protein
MIGRYFKVDAHKTDAMHADPTAALDALKLASLAVTRDTSLYLALRAALQLRKTAVLRFCPSTHRYRYGPFLLKMGSRAAPGDLDSAHHSRSL